jgi:hypothetical protein
LGIIIKCIKNWENLVRLGHLWTVALRHYIHLYFFLDTTYSVCFPVFSLFWMLALYSNFTSWCSQYLSSLISNCLTSFASITDCGRVFHKSTILLVKENLLKFILQNFFLIFLYSSTSTVRDFLMMLISFALFYLFTLLFYAFWVIASNTLNTLNRTKIHLYILITKMSDMSNHSDLSRYICLWPYYTCSVCVMEMSFINSTCYWLKMMIIHLSVF